MRFVRRLKLPRRKRLDSLKATGTTTCLSPMAYASRKRSSSSYQTTKRILRSRRLRALRTAKRGQIDKLVPNAFVVASRRKGSAVREIDVTAVDGHEYGLGFNFELFTHSTTFFGLKVVLLGSFNLQKFLPEADEKDVRILSRKFITTTMLMGRATTSG